MTAAAPYVLPGWVEADSFKSLKALGLDTTEPGDYSITGIYSETGAAAGPAQDPQPLWGGSIASNTVTVHVSPKP